MRDRAGRVVCTHRDVGREAGDEGGGDGVGDGCVGTLGLLPCGGDDVKANKGVEASSSPLHDLLGPTVRQQGFTSKGRRAKRLTLNK